MIGVAGEFSERALTWGSEDLGDALVLGAGGSGVAVARYLAGQLGGRVSSVTVYAGASAPDAGLAAELEAAGCRVVSGTERVEGSYALCVASPGISERSGFFRSAAAASGEMLSEPEFAWRESPDRWVAITGTNGKTTTTTLARDLLRASGMDAQEVGNIGTLATGQVACRRPGSWFVAELSSYQLAVSSRLHPRVAALLNVTADHLAWHGTAEAYARAKERVFASMGPGDLAVVSVDDGPCRAVAARLEARGLRVCRVSLSSEPASPERAWLDGDVLRVALRGCERALVRAGDLRIKGEHNVENALVAAAVALECGAGADDVRRGLAAFRPLAHRIERVGRVAGVDYVDDSKATNVDAALKALTAFEAGRVVMLLGGTDKMTPLDGLADACCATCRAVVCYGEAGPRMRDAMLSARGRSGSALDVREAAHLADAVRLASDVARPGDVVLLSPACSSFDEFSGFEERGEAFASLVAAMGARDGE